MSCLRTARSCRGFSFFITGFVVIYLAGRFSLVPSAARAVRSRNQNNPTIETTTKTYLPILVIGFGVFTGMIVAGHGGIFSESAGIIAALTFAFGVAGQQVFGSMISGMFLVTDRDFNVGDWVEWPGEEGITKEINFRVTRVQTPNNKPSRFLTPSSSTTR